VAGVGPDDLAVDGGSAVIRLADGSVLIAGGQRAGAPSAGVWRLRPRLLGPYGAAASVVPGDVGSDPPLTPLDPARVATAPRWQLTAGAWAIAGGMIGDDLRLEWTGELPAEGAALLFGFVDAGHQQRAELVPGQPVTIVTVDGGEARVRCQGEPAPAAGPIIARVEPTADGVQVVAGGRTLVRCPGAGQSAGAQAAAGGPPIGRVGVGALGAGAVTIETLAVTR
jgi:hypothetical protein